MAKTHSRTFVWYFDRQPERMRAALAATAHFDEAARLQGEGDGSEIVRSCQVHADRGVHTMLEDWKVTEVTAPVRSFAEPTTFNRISETEIERTISA